MNWWKNVQRRMDALKKPIQKRLAEVEAEAEKLRDMLKGFGGGMVSNGRPATTTTTKRKTIGGKKRRIRRTPEQLAAEAGKVHKMIRDAGKEGISGSEIRKKFPGVGQNIKGFVKQYTGQTVKTTGQKVKMRYHA
jgi:hypothetical protein